MKFEEYPFDVTRLWDVKEAREAPPEAPRLTKRSRPARSPAAEVVPFPRVGRSPSRDPAVCLPATRAELAEIAFSLKVRDMARRNGLADRCAACGKCPDMTD